MQLPGCIPPAQLSKDTVLRETQGLIEIEKTCTVFHEMQVPALMTWTSNIFCGIIDIQV